MTMRLGFLISEERLRDEKMVRGVERHVKPRLTSKVESMTLIKLHILPKQSR